MTTLLKVVQDILSAMNSDEVNSVGDTVESRQVVTVVETAYNQILARTEFPDQYEIFELNASGDPNKPTLLSVPEGIDSIEWVRYNNPLYQESYYLKYLDPTEFLQRTLTTAHTHLDDYRLSFYSIYKDGVSTPVYFINDKGPTYYTYIHGIGVLTDSVNLGIEATVQKTKTIAYGRKSYSFKAEDTFVLPLDNSNLNMLYQEAKALAFAELKQTSHQIAERSVKESRINAQRRKDQSLQSKFYRTLPNYGRANYGRRITNGRIFD